jgi:hypothetical protein
LKASEDQKIAAFGSSYSDMRSSVGAAEGCDLGDGADPEDKIYETFQQLVESGVFWRLSGRMLGNLHSSRYPIQD